MTTKNSPATKAVEREFVLTRTLHAPPARVFKAWIDPKQMAQWWGPKEFTNPVCQMDSRPGGKFRIVMRAPDGTDYPFKGEFLEIAEPARLAYTNDTSEHGKPWHDMVNKNRPHANGKNIDHMITTVTFEERNGKTQQEIRMSFDSTEDRDALVNIGMAEGWSGSLDKLEALLAKS